MTAQRIRARRRARRLVPLALLLVALLAAPEARAGSETSDKSAKSAKSDKGGASAKSAKLSGKLKSLREGKSERSYRRIQRKFRREEAKRTRKEHSDNRGARRRQYAQRGSGLPAESNPTTIPIVDDDFLGMVVMTQRQLMAPYAHQRTRGHGVLVAVLDGGFDMAHPALQDRMLPWGYDAIDHDDDPHDMGNYYDDDGDGRVDGGAGHGTFVAGMVLLAAPDARILPIRVRDDEGWGTIDELERGLRFAFAMGAEVVNISGATPSARAHHLHALIAQMRDAGVVVVHSAGNDGRDEVPELGFGDDALVVGAVDWVDRVAPFSNRTNESLPMVFAPGQFLHGPLGLEYEGSHGYWSGTSFSAGLVSGGAALIISQEPWLRARDVMRRLQDTADPVMDEAGREMRHGRINLWKAVTR